MQIDGSALTGSARHLDDCLDVDAVGLVAPEGLNAPNAQRLSTLTLAPPLLAPRRTRRAEPMGSGSSYDSCTLSRNNREVVVLQDH